MKIGRCIPYEGGIVECAPADEFTTVDDRTGQPKTVQLPDRVVITYGRRKVTLNGPMIAALSRMYVQDDQFRSWTDSCQG